GGGVGFAVEKAAQAVAFAFRRGKAGLQGGEIVHGGARFGLLQREQFSQFGDLRVEPVEDGIAAGYLLTQEELYESKDRQQEDEDEQEVRQYVDEGRPIFGARRPMPAAGDRHYSPAGVCSAREIV